MKLTRYRVRPDKYSGWEALAWRPWWPFWCQFRGINSWRTKERAKDYIDKMLLWESYEPNGEKDS